MFVKECLADCPICGDEICLVKTRNHKRFAKCINEDCGKTVYALPKAGTIENTSALCPINQLPILAIVPNLRLPGGDFRRQEKKTYFWVDKPCFTCRKVDSCEIHKELLEDY